MTDRRLALTCLLLGACSADRAGDAASQSPVLRLAPAIEVPAAANAVAGALEAALAKASAVDALVAPDAAAATAAALACRAARPAVRIVAIAGPAAAAAKLVDDGTAAAVIERPTAAAAAIDLVLLAVSGIAPPERLLIGARILTKANAAAGGKPVPAPGDFVLDLLRRQHGDTLTTTPTIDVVFRIGVVVAAGDDPFLAALRDELFAAAKRYPQLAAEPYATVAAAVAANVNGLLVAPTDEPTAVAARQAAATDVKVVAVGREPLGAPPLRFAGVDEERLGAAAGEALRDLLGAGGTVAELQRAGDPFAAARAAGLGRALGATRRP